jgi:hypothetical protein
VAAATLRARGPIQVGDSFTWDGNTFTRLPDDDAPAFECERIQIRCDRSPMVVDHQPYTFGAEPEWFRQRGFDVGAAT